MNTNVSKIKSITWQTTLYLCGNLLFYYCVQRVKIKCIIFPFAATLPFLPFSPLSHSSPALSLSTAAISICKDSQEFVCMSRHAHTHTVNCIYSFFPSRVDGSSSRLHLSNVRKYCEYKHSRMCVCMLYVCSHVCLCMLSYCTCFDLFGIITDAFTERKLLLFIVVKKLLMVDNRFHFVIMFVKHFRPVHLYAHIHI